MNRTSGVDVVYTEVRKKTPNHMRKNDLADLYRSYQVSPFSDTFEFLVNGSLCVNVIGIES